MARTRRFSQIRRALVRRLDGQEDSVLIDLRNELWERLIVRKFMCGHSVEHTALMQPNWGTIARVEDALRSQVRKRGGLR
jgi:hypothetical protein